MMKGCLHAASPSLVASAQLAGLLTRSSMSTLPKPRLTFWPSYRNFLEHRMDQRIRTKWTVEWSGCKAISIASLDYSPVIIQTLSLTTHVLPQNFLQFFQKTEAIIFLGKKHGQNGNAHSRGCKKLSSAL